MSEEELRDNLDLLESLHKYGQEALIEADKIEYLNEDGLWVGFDKLGLSLVPILIYTNRYKNDSKLVYELFYQLLTPKVKITPYFLEQIEFKSNHQCEKPYNRCYSCKENINVNNDGVNVRYNNTNIRTLSRVKRPDEMIFFKKKYKNLLYSSACTVKNSIISNSKQKTII